MFLRRILTITLIAGLLVAAATATFLRGGYERMYWLPISILIICLLAMVAAAQNHDYLPRHFNLRVGVPFGLYLLWAALSYPRSVNHETTMFELYRLLTLAIVIMLASVVFENKWEKWVIALGIWLLGLAEALYSLTERATGQALLSFDFLPHVATRVTGTFGNSNHFSDFLNMSFFVGLALMSARRGINLPTAEKWAQKALFALPLGVILVAQFLTLSRGGWFAGGVGFMIWFWLLWRHRRPALARAPLAAALVLAIAIIFIARQDLTPARAELATLGEFYQAPEELTRDGRLSVWKSSLLMIKDRPLLGSGLGTFRWVYPSYRRDKIFYGVRFAHNDYLQIAAEIGVPGLIFYLAFIFMLLREAGRTIARRPDAPDSQALMAVTAGLVAVLVHELIDFGLAVPANMIVFYLMAGIVLTTEDNR